MPPNYYSDMTGLTTDSELFKLLLRERFPKLMRHLTKLDVEIGCASWQWFVTIFSYNIGLPELFRFWDLIFLKGSVALFELALCIIAVSEKELLRQPDAPSVLMALPNLAKQALEDKPLFFQTFAANKKCRVSQRWLDKMRAAFEV